jgi:hypothetical protein
MIYEAISRTLFAASLLAAACGTAAAQSAKVTVSSSPAVLLGTVSFRDLSSRPQVAQPARPRVEMPKHLLPDGSTSNPRQIVSIAAALSGLSISAPAEKSKLVIDFGGDVVVDRESLIGRLALEEVDRLLVLRVDANEAFHGNHRGN